MGRITRVAAFGLALLMLVAGPALGAEDSKVKTTTEKVERGAEKIGEGIRETAKGIGETVVEGARTTGEKIKQSARAAEPQAKSAWEKVREGAIDFGQSVKNFFSRLFTE